MKKLAIFIAGVMFSGLVQADSLVGVDKMICASVQVQICFENDTCYAAAPDELDVPEFVIIDLKEKSISTTRSSGLNRSTSFASVERNGGLIYLQGAEGGRVFSFVINEGSGHITAAVVRDGFSVSVFGSCTDSEI
jgi:hypothetical protein